MTSTPADAGTSMPRRSAELHIIEPRPDLPTAMALGAELAYDAEDFVNESRSMHVRPDAAQQASGRSSGTEGERAPRLLCLRQRIGKATTRHSAGSRRIA